MFSLKTFQSHFDLDFKLGENLENLRGTPLSRKIVSLQDCEIQNFVPKMTAFWKSTQSFFDSVLTLNMREIPFLEYFPRKNVSENCISKILDFEKL